MTWIDATSILFATVAILFVMRATREIKQLLSDARYERLELNRKIERLARRLDQIAPDSEPLDEE